MDREDGEFTGVVVFVCIIRNGRVWGVSRRRWIILCDRDVMMFVMSGG